MKKSICLTSCLLALTLTPVFGQPKTPPEAGGVTLTRVVPVEPELTKFNLDFPGGTPAELVKAVEKSMGKPLNVIISEKDAATKLPPLKLSGITFPQLAGTLNHWVRSKTGSVAGGGNMLGHYQAGYYFGTVDNKPTDNSIWFFRAEDSEQPPQPPQSPVQKQTKFYPLVRYLDAGMKVEDIIAAIQTGLNMSDGEFNVKYHEGTRLLIACGEPEVLRDIENALQALRIGIEEREAENKASAARRAANAASNSPSQGKTGK